MPLCDIDWKLTADWVGAGATLAAVLVALFGPAWWRWWQRPVLRVSINPNPPTCGTESPPPLFHLIAFVRLTVENTGRSPARNVSATIGKVCRREERDWVPLSAFLPTDLCWTHINRPLLPLLVPHLPKLVDLFVADPAFPKLEFRISVQPSRSYQIIGTPGAYRFSITAAAENAKPKTQHFEVMFSTGSFTEEEKLLSALQVSEVDRPCS